MDDDREVRLVAAMWEHHGFPPTDALLRAEIYVILAAPEPAERTAQNRNRRKEAK
ncbi:hypothetical protein [Streptomyces sp. NPDC051572]|uniref:hypothetical protein n=1 Tax=Streptomyces sp. NPDC051572 TaxID=3155802 RepID=UPI00344F9AE0